MGEILLLYLLHDLHLKGQGLIFAFPFKQRALKNCYKDKE